ncbi:M56 family metallopeptidase [Parafrankia elaeagni]|uniref:M56 family metallopeptidase n=1 Tax=Parafrankia elaeagni TaxID=222534 RepID=UPI00036ED115|nr:M56 family metallopeptidase [Parafrankia elaeagni]
MLDHLLVSVVAAPLLTMLALRLLVDRVWPRTVVTTGTAAALLVAAASMISLVALAAPAAISLSGLVAGGVPGGEAWQNTVQPRWVAWVALAALLAQVTMVAATARRQWTGLRAARAEAAALPGTDDITVVTDERVDAFALPGAPGRVVITSGMMTALTAEQREVVLAHERAHLAARHHRHTFAARLAAAAHPGLRPLAPLLAYAVERWADEAAARVVRDRGAVARGITAAALLTSSSDAPRGKAALHIGSLRRDLCARHGGRRPGGALGDGPDGPRRSARRLPLPNGSGPVPRRVAAMLAPALTNRPIRVLLSVLPAALAAASCGLAVEAMVDLPLPGALDGDC